jgi:predicted enzyme involved in methoxymalonyl-ACP biosynthesis
MSCRVLERGLEAAIIGELERCAAEAGAKEIVGHYRPTPRNGLVKELYLRLGFEAAGERDGVATYRLEPAHGISHAPPMQIVLRTPSPAPGCSLASA